MHPYTLAASSSWPYTASPFHLTPTPRTRSLTLGVPVSGSLASVVLSLKPLIVILQNSQGCSSCGSAGRDGYEHPLRPTRHHSSRYRQGKKVTFESKHSTDVDSPRPLPHSARPYEHSPRRKVMRASPISVRVLVHNDPPARCCSCEASSFRWATTWTARRWGRHHSAACSAQLEPPRPNATPGPPSLLRRSAQLEPFCPNAASLRYDQAEMKRRRGN